MCAIFEGCWVLGAEALELDAFGRGLRLPVEVMSRFKLDFEEDI